MPIMTTLVIGACPAATHEARWAAPRAEFRPLGGQRSGEAASVGGSSMPATPSAMSARFADDARRADLDFAGQPIAQRPREVAHCADIVDEPLMQPAQNLPRPKRLLAAFGEKRRERVRVEVEQIDH